MSAAEPRLQPSPRDWSADASQCTNRCASCDETFFGHKRRMTCHMCAVAVPAHPDLSQLDRETRILVALEEVRGRTWCSVDDPFTAGEGERTAWRIGGMVVRDDGEAIYTAPNPLHDPAAWGAVQRDELIDVEHLGPVLADLSPWGRVRARYCGDPDWHAAEDDGAAVCAAVLAKHGVEVEP